MQVQQQRVWLGDGKGRVEPAWSPLPPRCPLAGPSSVWTWLGPMCAELSLRAVLDRGHSQGTSRNGGDPRYTSGQAELGTQEERSAGDGDHRGEGRGDSRSFLLAPLPSIQGPMWATKPAACSLLATGLMRSQDAPLCTESPQGPQLPVGGGMSCLIANDEHKVPVGAQRQVKLSRASL